MTNQSVNIELDCGHSRWYSRPLPRKGDWVYCVICNNQAQVGMPEQTSEIYEVEWEWISRKTGREYIGKCFHCEYESRNRIFSQLARTMEKHHLRGHVWTTLISEAVLTTRAEVLPPNSKPPF